MSQSTMRVRKEDLAMITAGLVREGVIFKVTPCIAEEDGYILEFTGGF